MYYGRGAGSSPARTAGPPVLQATARRRAL